MTSLIQYFWLHVINKLYQNEFMNLRHLAEPGKYSVIMQWILYNQIWNENNLSSHNS